MCEKYVNIQTKEVLDLERVKQLPNNAMLKVKPELWHEWNFEKNSELGCDIWKMKKAYYKNVEWICSKCNSNFPMRIDNRVYLNQQCSYCRGYKVNETNSIERHIPEIVKWWDWEMNIKNPTEIPHGSPRKVYLICPNCKSKFVKHLNNVKKRGLICKNCSDGIPLGEKIIYIILNELKIEFEYDSSMEWSNNKRYDFYIPSLNMIIEVQGEQHRDGKFGQIGGRSLEEEQKNDEFKQDIALKNNIENYLKIDYTTGKYSEFYDDLLGELSVFINTKELSKSDILEKSFISLVSRVAEYWNKGMTSSSEIAFELNLTRTTVSKYLKMADNIGVVKYNNKIAREKYGDLKNKKVVMLSNDEIISIFHGVRQAIEFLGKGNASAIYNCCNGITDNAYGYDWAYEDIYNKYITGEELYYKIYKHELSEDSKLNRKVVKLSLNNEYLEEFNSIREATASMGVNRSHISTVCNGKRKTSNGYKWMYKEDYEKINRSD